MAVRAAAVAESGSGAVKREDWPKIGTQLYFVCEHIYNTEDRTANKEYVVCSGELTGYSENSSWTAMRIVGTGPYGYEIVSYYKPQEIGSKVFHSAKEAAQRAKQLTDHDDKAWGAVSPPMRRLLTCSMPPLLSKRNHLHRMTR